MRSLSPALISAQRKDSAEPYVQVQVKDLLAGVPRLRWERLYTGSDSGNFHACALAGDGALLRARVAGGQAHYQRVAAPGPGSNFSNWSALAPAAEAGVALAATGSRVLLFYVDTNGVTIRMRESLDYGAGFGAPSLLVTAPAAVSWLAAGGKPDGTVLLLYAAGAAAYSLKRMDGVWGQPALWPHSVFSISGLACLYQGDFNVAVAGAVSPGHAKLWTAVYGDGHAWPSDSWSPLFEVAMASPGSNLEFLGPSLAYPDVFRLSFTEKYTALETYSRPYSTYLPQGAALSDNAWREPFPLVDETTIFDVALASGEGYAWLATLRGVWRAPISSSTRDVTGDVLALSLEESPHEGRLRLALRNDDGRYAQLASGVNFAIRPGSEVHVSPGYHTEAGPESSAGPVYWIEGWEHTSSPGEASFIIQAGNGWSLLSAWRIRRQFVWEKGEASVLEILASVIERAGLELDALDPSPTCLELHPSFTIHPGEDGAMVVRRLLAMTPDALFFRGRTACLKNQSAGEAASYSYGVEHPVLRVRHRAEGLRANRVQSFGSGLLVEAFDWVSMGELMDRIHQVSDLNLDTEARAAERAAFELERERKAAIAGEIIVPVNCGQELYDVVEVTAAGAGLQAARRRVIAMGLEYSAGRRPVYQQRLLLSAP